MKTHRRCYLLIIGLVLSFNLKAAPLAFDNITARGSVSGAPAKQLTGTAFRDLQTNENARVGTWLGLVRNLQSDAPEVHIIDDVFYSDAQKVGFRSTFGIHEAYSRFHGFASDTDDYIGQVLGRGDNKKLLPFTLHVPLNGPASTSTGKSINWVFQNRRYRYKDSSTSFVKALIKGQQAVKKHIFPQSAENFINSAI